MLIAISTPFRFVGFILLLLLGGVACTHPVDISGKGDVSSKTGQRNCIFGSSPCDFVITGDYKETYTALPRSGHRFSHWDNCTDADGDQCHWDVAADVVKNHWSRTMPALRANFVLDDEASLSLSVSPSPISLNGIQADFVQDIRYGDHSRSSFDIFMPKSQSPTALIIYIHGGGFVSGDKSLAYEGSKVQEIRRYLRQNIAFAAINYRYLKRNPQGLLATLNDAKHALQFIRYHSTSLNINKNRVAVYGDSAGAGTSLWLALQDDAADVGSSDPVLRESTRVRGVAALEGQATYDFVQWETSVFSPFNITVSEIAAADRGLGRRILEGLNINSISEAYGSLAEPLRAQMDMLNFMSSDDPEVYIASAAQTAEFPTNKSTLVHHPFHARALRDRAVQVGLANITYIPKLNIHDPSGENHVDYLIRKVR